MNKVQRNCVADHLSDILRKMERLEDRFTEKELDTFAQILKVMDEELMPEIPI